MPRRRCVRFRAFALALLATTALAGVSCQQGGERQALGPALTRLLPDDSPVPVAQQYHGFARNPSSLPHTGVFVIESPVEFRRLWEAQCDGPAPDIAWQRSTVVAIFLVRSEATGLAFHELRRNPDRGYTAWFVGQTTPLTTVRYSYPWAIAVLPLSAGTIRVNMVYARRNAIEAWELRDRGTWLTIE